MTNLNQKYLDMFRACKSSPDHPIYHPEKYLGRHIALVTLKSVLLTDNKTLTMAALFHDICKPYPTGEFVHLPEGSYFSNKYHAEQAAELVLEYDLRYWMWHEHGVDNRIVADIIYYHMRCKGGMTKKTKLIPYMDIFVKLDDMVERTDPLLGITNDLHLPLWSHTKKEIELTKFVNRRVHYVGQTFIQRHYREDEWFTITTEDTRGIFDYKFSDIPTFFHGKWQWIEPIAKLLV